MSTFGTDVRRRSVAPFKLLVPTTKDGPLQCVGCGGELSGATGSFVSPNHPLPYGHATECFWNITVSRGSKIRLQFLEFNLEQHYTCLFDYVEVSFS